MQLFQQRWVGMSLDDAMNLGLKKGYGTFAPTLFTLELSKPKHFHWGRALYCAIFAIIPLMVYVAVYSLWTRNQLVRLTADSTGRVIESSVERGSQSAVGYIPGIVVLGIVLIGLFFLVKA